MVDHAAAKPDHPIGLAAWQGKRQVVLGLTHPTFMARHFSAKVKA
jgi:hypothetical protein